MTQSFLLFFFFFCIERPSSTRLEARLPYHGSGAVTRSPSPLAWRPDFPGAPREAH